MIAGAAYEVVEPCAFAAEDEDAVAGEVELVVIGCATFVETDDPEIPALEIFESAHQIDDAGDAQMLCGAGTGLDGDRAKGRGAALGEHDAIDAGAVGYAEKSAEVLRIFNAVEGEQRRAKPGCCGIGREQIFNCERCLPMNEGDDPLMRDVLATSVSCSRDSWRTRTPSWRQRATTCSRRASWRSAATSTWSNRR